MIERGQSSHGKLSARRLAQQGFTLVEMAIVLVIIGLIIGGILKGQEIVNNARVKSQVAQIDGVKAAAQTFVDKYGFYPGDDTQASTQLGVDGTFNGRGDGFVSQVANTADVDSVAEGVSEPPNAVWYEMQIANLISGVLSASPQTSPQTNAIAQNLEGKIAASYLTYADFSVADVAGAALNKMIRIQGTLNPNAPTPVMRVADASQIDFKYDDGEPSTGQILAASYSNNQCCKNASCLAAAANYGLLAGAGGSTAGTYCALIWIAQ